VAWLVSAQEHRGRCRAVEPRVRPEVSVVSEGELKAALESPARGRWHGAQSHGRLRRSPESLDDCDRALLPDGAEALLDAEGVDELPERFCAELLALVCDEVAWRSEVLDCELEERGESAGVGLGRESRHGEWHPGIDVEDDGQKEAPDPSNHRVSTKGLALEYRLAGNDGHLVLVFRSPRYHNPRALGTTAFIGRLPLHSLRSLRPRMPACAATGLALPMDVLLCVLRHNSCAWTASMRMATARRSAAMNRDGRDE
jgi:hypothetical protein